MRDFVLGAVGGGVAAWLVWLYASRQLDARMQSGSAELTTQFGQGRAELDRALAAGRTQLDRAVRARVAAEVPPAVERGISQALTSYGITQVEGQRISRVLARAEAMGLIGVTR